MPAKDREVGPGGDRILDREEVPTLRVAASSDAKAMANAIESRILDFQAVKLEVVGAMSVNQAAKATAIARVSLEQDGSGLALYPEFIHIPSNEDGAPERSALLLHAFEFRSYEWIDEEERDGRILRVSAKSEAKSISIDIVSRIRDGPVRVQAVGPGSVNQAVKAIAIARKQLSELHGRDMVALPSFVNVPAPDPSERDHSALRWTLIARRGAGGNDRGTGRENIRKRGGEARDTGRAQQERAIQRPERSLVQAMELLTFKGDADLPDVQDLRVAAGSEAKSVAGAIATRLRDSIPVRLTVMGPNSVNQMVKALALARTRLQDDGMDLAAYAPFTHLPASEGSKDERSAIQVTAKLCKPHPGTATIEYKVGGGTNPKSTAGAISNSAREGTLCGVEALGPDAVSTAVKAIAIARANLEADKIDVVFAPQFRTLELSNGRRSALELLVLPLNG
eukprot:NODE_2147_length_1499_cov_10.616279_g2042_i0.p1 GENE.NODE_2147_length_1499_cov_10.616279_g2042_i0~~NODE_2147_length_1499_cov_10.616279_g2042_i0.p1  ORF type:complete len:471 (-),score=86.96 NODE_2147_length_1499_cov_10.616279_g2042_i0:87-1445(-)